MSRLCGQGNVSRCLSIEGIRDGISWVWDPTTYKAFLAMLRAREFGGLLLLRDQSRLHGKLRKQWSLAHRRGWARCDGLSIRHLPPTTPWSNTWAKLWEVAVDVEMAGQRGVSAFAWEGRACDPLLDLAHLVWTSTASSTGTRQSVVHRQQRLLRRT
jgi:hypothetical protein